MEHITEFVNLIKSKLIKREDPVCVYVCVVQYKICLIIIIVRFYITRNTYKYSRIGTQKIITNMRICIYIFVLHRMNIYFQLIASICAYDLLHIYRGNRIYYEYFFIMCAVRLMRMYTLMVRSSSIYMILNGTCFSLLRLRK